MIHPAHEYDFQNLYAALHDEISAGAVFKTTSHDGLELFCYTRQCTYDRMWNDVNKLARGLIIDPVEQYIVATPFPKFFNLGERSVTPVDQMAASLALPFEAFEKLDGSLIIIFNHNGQWRCATKGSFVSDQAKWAKAELDKTGFDLNWLDPHTTYLCEAVYAANRIVINYQFEGLVLLAAYTTGGYEASYDYLQSVSNTLGWCLARRYDHKLIEAIVDIAAGLNDQDEGFVIRFDDGFRIKIKGAEYCRVHRLVSNLTPLSIWELLCEGNMNKITDNRFLIPEEFWADFDRMYELIEAQVKVIVDDVAASEKEACKLTDKELGLSLHTYPDHVRKLIFPMRKHGTILRGRSREVLYRMVRPTGNVLAGYVPGARLNKLMEEIDT